MHRTQRLSEIRQPRLQDILLASYVVDNIEPFVDKVVLAYRIWGYEEYTEISMQQKSVYLWKGIIPTDDVRDSLEYYIKAITGAPADTTFLKSKDNPFRIPVCADCNNTTPPFVHLTQATLALLDVEQPYWQPIKIDAYVKPDSSFEDVSVNLYYKPPFSTDYVKSPLGRTAVDSVWTTTIPAEAALGGTIPFYVELNEGIDEVTDPYLHARQYPHKMRVQSGNTPPMIRRTEQTIALSDAPQTPQQTLSIEAVIVDTTYPFVDSAMLNYRRADDEYTVTPMIMLSDSVWRAQIPADSVLPDSVYYYISASDGDTIGYAPNIENPAGRPFVIAVQWPNAPPIVTPTPETIALGEKAQPAYTALTIAATIVDTLGPGVQAATLHYRSAAGGDYVSVIMINSADSTWNAEIPAAQVQPDTIRYYISATDGLAPGYAPGVERPWGAPFIIRVSPASLLRQDLSVRPNPFTPNNDGYNDRAVFYVSGLDEGRGRVAIYNRRGRKVREIYGDSWDGRDDAGSLLPPGVYLFAVHVDGQRSLSGTITLIR